MVTMAYIKNAGHLWLHKLGVQPQSAGAGAINGIAVDRQDFRSAKVQGLVGAATVMVPVVYKVQHGDTSGGPFADYTPTNGDSTFTITTVSTAGSVDVDLSQAKQWVRVVATVGAGGSAVLVSASVALSGGEWIKAADTVPSSQSDPAS